MFQAIYCIIVRDIIVVKRVVHVKGNLIKKTVMTILEYEALKKAINEATRKLESQKELFTSTYENIEEMITAVATTLQRYGVPQADPIITEFNDNVIGGGDYQHQYYDGSGNLVPGVSGVWNYQSKAGQLNNDQHYSNTTNAYFEFRFTGTKIEWYSEKFPWHGISEISIDGVVDDTADQYNATELLDQLLYTSGTLTNGPHVIKIRVTGTRNASNTNGTSYVVHDKFKVYSTLVPPTAEPDDDLYDYIVSPTGVASAPGTRDNPTSVAVAQGAPAGSVIGMLAGTYRTTITPTNSGTSGNLITWMAIPGNTVIVSGLEQVAEGGWSVHDAVNYPGVYKKTVTLPTTGHQSSLTSNTSILANQIFKDGEMQFEATSRQIDSVDDLFLKTKWKALAQAAFQPTYLDDSALNGKNLTGATVNIQGWFATDSRTITSQSGNRVNYSSYAGGGDGYKYRRWYTISNHLQLCTRDRYWHYQGGILYYKQPGGGTPTGLEHKARNWGFDLRSKSYIKVTGINFKGCEPCTGNDSTNYNTFDNIKATYTNHIVAQNVYQWQGVGMTRQCGMKLTGTGNVLINSEISYASTQGVWIGANGRVENNYIHHIGYDGGWGAGVDLWGEGTSVAPVDNVVITRNTIAYTTRSSVSLGYGFAELDHRRFRNMDISYNDFSKWCLFSDDGGAIYSWGYRDHSNSRCHHNWFHDDGFVLNPLNLPQAGRLDGIAVAFYMDQGAGPFTVDHNIFWNVCQSFLGDAADVYSQFEFKGGATPPGYRFNGGCLYYNNTFWSNSPTTYTSYVAAGKSETFRNNISRKQLNFNWGNGSSNVAYALLQNSQTFPQGTPSNTVQNTNPLFVGGSLTSPQDYFELQAGSAAVNTGLVITGITDGAIGAPDKGGYERSAGKWIPGRTPVAYEP